MKIHAKGILSLLLSLMLMGSCATVGVHNKLRYSKVEQSESKLELAEHESNGRQETLALVKTIENSPKDPLLDNDIVDRTIINRHFVHTPSSVRSVSNVGIEHISMSPVVYRRATSGEKNIAEQKEFDETVVADQEKRINWLAIASAPIGLASLTLFILAQYFGVTQFAVLVFGLALIAVVLGIISIVKHFRNRPLYKFSYFGFIGLGSGGLPIVIVAIMVVGGLIFAVGLFGATTEELFQDLFRGFK